DTFKERRSAGGKLRKNPPIGKLVIENDGIAGVVGLAVPAKTAPQRVVRSRTKEGISRLIEDLEMHVVHRHHVIRTDRTVGIRRRATAAEVDSSVKADDGGRDPNLTKYSLHDRIANKSTGGFERNRALYCVFAERQWLCRNGRNSA